MQLLKKKIAAKELVKQELETAKYRVNHANTNQDVQDVVTLILIQSLKSSLLLRLKMMLKLM